MNKLTVTAGPHVKAKDSTTKIMWTVIAALIPAMIYGIFNFGAYSGLVVLVSVGVAVLTEIIMQKIMARKITVYDGSAVLTGLLLAMISPSHVPLWVIAVGSFIAIAIAKHAFGGLGANIFNPALVGRAFLVASFPVAMTKYMLPDGITGATPLQILKGQGGVELMKYFGSVPKIWSNSFIGSIGGSLGETSALLLLLGGVYLIIKDIIDWRIPVVYLLTVALGVLAFGHDPIFHLLSGGLMIGAFFMATDYVTSPLTKKGRVIFALGLGILTVVLRLFSAMPEGVCYSILLMNAAVPLIDRYTKRKKFGRKKE